MKHEALAPAALRSAVVLGAGGLVGQLFVRQLRSAGLAVTGVDLHPMPAGITATWLQCNATTPSATLNESLAAADAVVSCLPEPATLAALPTVISQAPADSLLIDTLSVKTRLAVALQSLRPEQEYLSLNPMFAPRLGFAGQNVAIVQGRLGSRAKTMLSLLEEWGARLTAVTAQEHDRLTALIQVATHAALLSLGTVLGEWQYDLKRGVSIATPPHRLCLALLARMSDAAPEVYWDIQHSNPYGAEVRQAMINALDRLSRAVEQEDQRSFEQILGGIAHVVQPLRNELLSVAEQVSAASSL